MGVWDRVVSGFTGLLGSTGLWLQMKSFAPLLGQAGDQLANASQALDTLPLSTRQALVSKIGVGTAASLSTVESESFNAFVNAATGAPSPIISGAQTASADSLNAALQTQGYEYPAFIPKTNVLLGPSVPNQYVRVYTSGTAGAEHGNPLGKGGRLQIYWNRGVIDWSKVASYFTNDRPIGSVAQCSGVKCATDFCTWKGVRRRCRFLRRCEITRPSTTPWSSARSAPGCRPSMSSAWTGTVR
jgi:hypothetical protein